MTLFLHVLLSLAVTCAIAQLFGWIFRRLGQPSVLGEITGGFLLGPTAFGAFAPELSSLLFTGEVIFWLRSAAQVGVLVFMFFTGIEFNLASFTRKPAAAFAIAGGSLALPFLLGLALGPQLFNRYSGELPHPLAFTIFCGVALCVTAFPVLARILDERKALHSRLGSLALGCAAINDVAAWCLLAVVTSLVRSRADGSLTIFFLTVVFTGALLSLGPFARELLLARPGRPQLGRIFLLPLAAGFLVCSALAEWIGIHALFGAFLFGVIIPTEHRLNERLLKGAEGLARFFLMPAFFAVTGLRTDLWQLDLAGDFWILMLVLAAAISGKFIGTTLAARTAGLSWKDGSVIGVLMNTRGLVELIVLNVGLDLKVINPKLFSIFVFMALFTTYATGPLLSLVWKREASVPPALESTSAPAGS